MIIFAKAVGRLTILAVLITVILAVTIITEIMIDNLTSQVRDLRHLLKHSLGNIGTLMVFLSLAGYMIKRRWRTFPGRLVDWLYIHQLFATVGTVLIGIHSGAHFNATIPILTYLFMLTCLVSGFIGRFVYIKSMKDLNVRKTKFLDDGIDKDEAAERLAFAVATTKKLAKWRAFHSPVSIILILFVLLHSVSALYFGG